MLGKIISKQHYWFNPYIWDVIIYNSDVYCRHLEEDYLNTAMTVEELTIAAEPEASDIMLCPVCLRNELKLDDKNPRKWQHVCVDCQNMTCSECGKFESSLNTKVNILCTFKI